MTKELPNPLVAELMARKFHEAYERLASRFGYETRPDTKAFDPASPNGKLMIAVCSELLAQQEAVAWQIMEHDGSWLLITKALFDRYKSAKDEQVRALTPLLETKE